MRHRCKGHRAGIWRRSEAKHCSSLCSQSEGDEDCGGQTRIKNPTKSWPEALVMFATCSWPSLCEQSELQCWRRNRRLCGPVQISAVRTLSLTFNIPILNALPFRGIGCQTRAGGWRGRCCCISSGHRRRATGAPLGRLCRRACPPFRCGRGRLRLYRRCLQPLCRGR